MSQAEKFYHGRRDQAGTYAWVSQGQRAYALPMRTDVRNHSPTGFNWGYGGSGPAQLALAILCDLLGDETEAQDCYQRFKFEVIGKIKDDVWTMSGASIRIWYDRLEREIYLDPRDLPSRN